MNSRKEPEPGPGSGMKSTPGHAAGRSLRISAREGQGHFCGAELKEFIDG